MLLHACQLVLCVCACLSLFICDRHESVTKFGRVNGKFCLPAIQTDAVLTEKETTSAVMVGTAINDGDNGTLWYKLFCLSDSYTTSYTHTHAHTLNKYR